MGEKRKKKREKTLRMGGETVSETDEHIHADSLPFDCLKMQTRTHGRTHAHRQTHLLSAAGRI